MSETEARAKQDIGQDEAWTANLKKVFEGEMDESSRSRLLFQLMATNVVTTLSSINNAIAQGANQLIENRQLGFDRMWNVDEQGYQVEDILGQPYVDAIKAAVAAAVAEALSKKS